jgi:hypothetical protein
MWLTLSSILLSYSSFPASDFAFVANVLGFYSLFFFFVMVLSVLPNWVHIHWNMITIDMLMISCKGEGQFSLSYYIAFCRHPLLQQII